MKCTGYAVLLTFSVVIFSGCSKARQEAEQKPEPSSKISASQPVKIEEHPSSVFPASGAAFDTGTVVIYSPHDAEPLNADITAFMAEYPRIKVELVAGGTGELAERIKAESSSPRADVFWGGGADTMQAYSKYFEQYVCKNDAAISPQFKDRKNKWTGESPLPMVIIYNRKLLAESGVEPPKKWDDCLNPAYKGRIAFCQPSKSGSAYTQLCTMILAHGGSESGWNFVKKFVSNLDSKILDSSGKCHKLVASGVYMIGITIEKSAILYLDNPNIGFCYPSDGTSAVPDAVAIVKNCPHKTNAQLFIDFVTSYKAQQEQSQDWSRRPSRLDLPAPLHLTSMKQIALVDYDLDWAASQKEENIRKFSSLMNKQ